MRELFIIHTLSKWELLLSIPLDRVLRGGERGRAARAGQGPAPHGHAPRTH